MGDQFKTALLFLACCCMAAGICMTASAATTEVHIVKYAADNTTVLSEKTVTYQWMETNLPVMGDGTTHYYHQGPVFVDDADPVREEQLRWNAAEDKNVQEKDMGAVKGTNLKDLCDLVGGMAPGDVVMIKADDGFARTFAYENVYNPTARQGPMVIAWYSAGEGYVPDFRQGMRLVFLADNSTNPFGLHVFGNNDWHSSAPSQYWYYYQQGQPPEKYPTTTGLSVQYISGIRINTAAAASAGPQATTKTALPASPAPTRSAAALSTSLTATGLVVVVLIIQHRRDSP